MNARSARAQVVIYGTGKLSADLLRYAPETGLKIVAVVSADTSKRGADAGALMLGHANGVPVVDFTYTPAEGTSCLLYGGNDGDRLTLALEWAARSGLDAIVSVLLAPVDDDEESARLDQLARDHGTRVLSTGLLPGFQLDVAPALIASTVPDPVDVSVTRVSMISTWSDRVLADEASIGKAVAEPAATLVGYMRASLVSLQRALAIEVDDLDLSYTPLLAAEPLRVGGLEVSQGCVRGFHYRIVGRAADRERIRVDWWSSTGGADEPEEGTRVAVTGPDGHAATAAFTLPREGYPATAARMIKSVVPLSRLKPGLRSAVELGTA